MKFRNSVRCLAFMPLAPAAAAVILPPGLATGFADFRRDRSKWARDAAAGGRESGFGGSDGPEGPGESEETGGMDTAPGAAVCNGH